MNKILIIGSNGFIGSHLLKFFRSKDGWEAYGADIVKYVDDVQYYDISSNEPEYFEIFQSRQFDYCINASGLANVRYSFEHTLEDFQLNVYNVIRILNAIKKNSPGTSFINLSSAAVYGNPLDIPVSIDEQLKPISPYGWHKLIAEEICKEYHQVFDLRVCNARIFSAYGPGQRKQLFWDLYQKVKKGKELSLFGSGEESRDFIHIDDLVRALYITLTHSKFNAQVINIANGEEITIKRAASTFVEVLKWDGSVNFSNEEKSGDPLHWKADIADLISYGYQPSVNLKAGLTTYKEWLERNLL